MTLVEALKEKQLSHLKNNMGLINTTPTNEINERLVDSYLKEDYSKKKITQKRKVSNPQQNRKLLLSSNPS